MNDLNELPRCTCGHRAWNHGSQSGFPARGEPCHGVVPPKEVPIGQYVALFSSVDRPCKGYESGETAS